MLLHPNLELMIVQTPYVNNVIS